MPFKTRRQKETAAARRFTFADSGSVQYSASDKSAVETKTKPERVVQQEPKRTTGGIENLDYVRRDLLKILFAASLIIGAQILLRLTLS